MDRMRDSVEDTAREIHAYLASPQGQRLRAILATGMIAAAPFLSQLPIMRATRVGRVLGIAGGAALIVKAAEMLRDWEPQPIAS